MLSSIAGQLGRRGLSPDQLFPAAVLSQRRLAACVSRKIPAIVNLAESLSQGGG